MSSAYKEYSVDRNSTGLVDCVRQLRANGGQDVYTALLILKMFEFSYPELQSELGDCYYEGVYVQKNVEKAFNLFSQAASRGSIQAHYDLGWYYYDRGEYLRAIENFSVCISHKTDFTEYKLSQAYACLGSSYYKLSEPKISSAIENLAIAAEKYHNGYACRCLGKMYATMDAQYFDAKKAIKYFELGISFGDLICAHELGVSYILGDNILQIKPNRQKAEEILLPLSDSQDYNILRDLGLFYKHDDSENGFSADYSKAKFYYEQAWAMKQNAYLASNLGYVYYRLYDIKKAEELLVIADTAGCTDASDFLGRIYRDGMLGTKDLNKAVFYYNRAYEAGDLNNVFTFNEFAELLVEIGDYQKAYDVAEEGDNKFNDICFVFIKANLILTGKITNKMSVDEAADMMETCVYYDTKKEKAHMALGKYYLSAREFRKAEKNYLDAFSMGVADAGFFLGRLYEYGGGTINADINKAYEWYSKAANAGSVISQRELGCFKKGMFGGYKRISNVVMKK